MRTHTAAFKQKIGKFGRQLDTEISYITNEGTIVLENEDINSITPHYEGSILKSIMKELEIDSNVDIPVGSKINYCKFGVKVRDDVVDNYKDNYDYIDFGTYYVFSSEKKEDTRSYKIKCYDKMINAMKDYNGVSNAFPMTVRDYINSLCTQIDLTFKNSTDTFANYDKVIAADPYLNAGYTYRAIFNELAEVTASVICINEDDEELEIRYINDTGDELDEEYLKDTNVNFGEIYGPVNTVILARAGGADKISVSDPDTLTDKEKIAIEITDNQIMNFNDRDEYIEDILDTLVGLEFAINDYVSTGICYYDIYDKYSITVGETTYPCIMVNDEINITQGLEENIHFYKPEVSVTEYKNVTKTDRTINKANIIAKKNEGEIEALTSRLVNVEDKTGNMYTKEQIDTLIMNAETGVTNTFSEAGGNNILRNTNFSAREVLDTGQIYEYWYGNVVRQTNTSAVNGYSIYLQDTTLYQQQNVANGTYTLSFYYKIINPLATVKVVINGSEYSLTETRMYTLFQTGVNNIDPIIVSSNKIKIEFISDLADACEVYDIMLNIGTIKLAYSQNANEVVTNTVNISKGITITASDKDVKFVATPDGIKTKTLQDEDITTFTYQGMTTKQAVIEDQAIIVGILRQRVGDQVWDSLI